MYVHLAVVTEEDCEEEGKEWDDDWVEFVTQVIYKAQEPTFLALLTTLVSLINLSVCFVPPEEKIQPLTYLEPQFHQ